MNVAGKPYRSIWPAGDGTVHIVDQTKLPWSFEILRLTTAAEVVRAIRTMQVRGAPLIGATAAYGVALAMRDDPLSLEHEAAAIRSARPTAVNLMWAVDRMLARLRNFSPADRKTVAYAQADAIAEEDVARCRAIGQHGAPLIAEIAAQKPGPVNVLTHCNAGWLATVDWGTALAPIYAAHDAGHPVHVWVDETRPRNQGAALTAWELGQHGVPHTVIADNAGGYLMRRGQVDLAIVGADRVTCTGDVANKIGTYLKALAAHDTGVPFWVALPSSTIDWALADGDAIEIEARDEAELATITGQTASGEVATVRVIAPGSPAANPAFDVTPARLVTGLITERGRTAATKDALAAMFPDQTP